MNNKVLCSCGFPQSYPIPHEHDLTEREKQIINAFQLQNKILLEALKTIRNLSIKGKTIMSNRIYHTAKNALADYEASEVK